MSRIQPSSFETSSRRANSRREGADAEFAAPEDEGVYPEAAEQRAHYQAGPTQAIVEHLKGHTGWHAKSDILGATGIANSQWSAAVFKLIARGKIKRQGEKRGARYQVVIMGAKE